MLKINMINGLAPRKWAILSAVFFISLFQFGSMKALAVFVPQFELHLGMSSTEAGLSCSIGIAVARLLGPVWGCAARMTSNRTVTVLGGVMIATGSLVMAISSCTIHVYCSMVIHGIGIGLPLVGKILALKDYFGEDFNMANGITFIGGAIGMIIFAPIMEYLIDVYGWRGACVIFAALGCNICVAGVVMKDLTTEKENKSDYLVLTGEKDQVAKQPEHSYFLTDVLEKLKRIIDALGLSVLVTEPILCIYLAAFALNEVSVSGWVLFLFSYSMSLGFNGQTAAMFSAISGVGTLAGRVFFWPLIYRNLISSKMLLCLLAIGGCVSVLSYSFTRSFGGLAIVSFLTGLFVGTTSPLYITLLRELYPDDTDAFSGAVGLQYLCRGFGLLIGGPLTGWIFDQTGCFAAAFVTLAGIECLVVILIILTFCHRKR